MINLLSLAIAVAAGFTLILALGFFLIRLRLQVVNLLEDRTVRNLEIENGNLKMSIAELTSRLAVVERDISSVPQRPRGNINMSKRGQVIRLHRRGDASAEIASSLGLRRGEVELIIKLQQLSFAGQGDHARV